MTRPSLVKQSKVAASVFFYDAGNMSVKGRKDIATWLRKQAKFLEQHGKEFSKTCRSRYIYT